MNFDFQGHPRIFEEDHCLGCAVSWTGHLNHPEKLHACKDHKEVLQMLEYNFGEHKLGYDYRMTG